VASEVGKDSGLALIEAASEFCEQVYGRLLLDGITDPRPRQMVLATNALRFKRRVNGLDALPADVVHVAFWYLVPPDER
jgi:hypothetical protein